MAKRNFRGSGFAEREITHRQVSPGKVISRIEGNRLLAQCHGFCVPAGAPADVGEPHQGRHVQWIAFEHRLRNLGGLREVPRTPIQVGGFEHVKAGLQRIEFARLLDQFEGLRTSGDTLE
jgi:hypothetical protein